MKMKIIISVLSILAIILLCFGKVATFNYVESNDRDVQSFSTVAIWTGIIAGIIMVFVAFWTFRIHIVAGIIPFGVGASLVVYCAYLLWCKSLEVI